MEEVFDTELLDLHYRDNNNGYYDKSDDLLELYFDEIVGYDLLSVDEERDLAIKAKNGDENARLKLVEHNLRLVVSVAKYYKNLYLYLNDLNLSLADLVQFGNEGLVIASHKYDLEKGDKFRTYANYWIRQTITRGIANYSRTVRIPIHLHDCIVKVKKNMNEYMLLHGKQPSVEQLAEITNYSTEVICRALECEDLTISLSTTINEEDDVTLADIIEDENSVFDNVDLIYDKDIVKTIFDLAFLSEQEEYIIKARMGFYGKIYTLQEIADKLNLARDKVRRLELKSLAKLRRASSYRIGWGRIYQKNYEDRNSSLSLGFVI